MPRKINFAYYCSGHGYGHATRVSAFASSLLSLDVTLSIYIVSSVPSSVFSDCISRGALYRNIDVDPIIVQPLAYQVDRQKSLNVLQTFLSEKEEKLATEVQWLLSEQIDCVLSDAAFLACEAAHAACIPSILITNFTFDSVYSYLGAETSDSLSNLKIPAAAEDLAQDTPIPEEVLAPLVFQLLTGYRHAHVLLLLPGFIPIPSFFQATPLPAPLWIDSSTNRFRPKVESLLRALPTSNLTLFPSIPFPASVPGTGNTRMRPSSFRNPPRTVKHAPLLVRPASADIHTSEGRSKLLSSIGIPEKLHDPAQTQILVVSFGGQKIRRPNGGKSPSRAPSPLHANNATNKLGNSSSEKISDTSVHTGPSKLSFPKTHSRTTSTKIFIPGAPAPINSPTAPEQPNLEAITAYSPRDDVLLASPLSQDEPRLLPSSSWIAIICGVQPNWSISGDEEALPVGFYVAPPNVYMPDLTAVADVLMGKLGYGTVSESVVQATPLVYVPRPLFVEEYGLRLLLEAEGIGVELSRDEYESGAWADKVEAAYIKSKKRGLIFQDGSNMQKVQELASWVVKSVEEWRS